MNIVTSPDSVLPLALRAMERTPNPRLRDLIASLTRHLHAFVQETRLTEEEFEQALEFIVAIGQATGDKKNEVVLAADMLGVSTLVALQNNQDPQGESPAALLGPFWRANAPLCDARRHHRALRHAGHAARPFRARCATRRAGRWPTPWSTCGRPRRSACTRTRTRRRKT